VSFSESFDPDDPALIDRYPDYTTETNIGHDRPHSNGIKTASERLAKKKKYLSTIPD
jgi:hypothetical protein